jgi:hypothetical protein
MFRFRATTPYGFEDFLREAEESGSLDPGTAMIRVLERRRIPGIEIHKYPDPRENLLGFLRCIARDGQWGVNLDVRLD